MNLTEYQTYWDKAQPLMEAKLCQIKEKLEGRTDLVISEITEGGDEEFRLSMNLDRGDVCVLGLDFVLSDADVHECEGGVGVRLDLVGYGGLALGGYAPHNYTERAFTNDAQEMIDRIEQLDVDNIADYIINEALTNEQLQADIAKASA